MSAASAAQPMPATGAATPRVPVRTWLAVYLRSLAVQGSWNYETMLGNGIGFVMEPALHLLPGGVHAAPFKQAMARESRYFNAHPYLASVAIGALIRAELDGEPPERIERFRTALCGPLGSVGDRLVWAGWLPLCSLIALAAFGLGAGPLATVALFLILYNAGHLGLRAWGLTVGWKRGVRVAGALANPVLRRGPAQIARVAAVAAGIALPLALYRVIGPARTLITGMRVTLPTRGHAVHTLVIGRDSGFVAVVLVIVALGAALVVWLKGRVEGWRLALWVLAAFVLFSVIR
jgi:PTS system mannose-specific IID component